MEPVTPTHVAVPLEGAEVRYYPNYIPAERATQLYNHFLTDFSWKIRKTDYGKGGALYTLNRATCAFGDPGVKAPDVWGDDLVVEPWTFEMNEIRRNLERVTGHKYNICLCNYYATGKRGIGLHADNEERGSTDGIASISLGAARDFMFVKNSELNSPSRNKHVIKLGHGSMLLMGRGTQENYRHSVPDDKTIKDGRINLTFRWFDPVRYAAVKNV